MALLNISHNVLPERTIFCYRADDAESLDVAEYYASQRLLDRRQLIPLHVTSDNEIDYDTYISDIETPLLAAIERLTSINDTGVDSGHFSMPFIFCIILGYNLPHIVNYNGEKLAIASRVHRLGHDINPKYPNHSYDRKSSYWRFFDDLDNTQLYITAVIDGRTKQDAINLIQRSIKVDNQGYVSGKIVLDPYGNKLTDAQLEYQDQILTFVERDIENLGSNYTTTIDIDDPYKDPIVQFLIEDSFYWGWYTDVASPQMFRDTRTARAFLYNADDAGAADIKADVSEGGSWCNVAITANNPGYAATAGSVDAPGEDAYLNIRSFFESLQRGSCMGEAFLFSSQFTDWKLMLIGDPLMVVDFPLPFDEARFYKSNKDILYLIIRATETYLRRMDRLSKLIEDAIQYILELKDFSVMDIFFKTVEWRDNIAGIEVSKQYVGNLINSFSNYFASTHPGSAISNYLSEENILVTSRFADVYSTFTSQAIDSDVLFDDGAWEIVFVYTHEGLSLENIHFAIQVATDSAFTNTVYIIESDVSTVGWEYEKEVSDFYPLPAAGLPSNYASRRVRFISPEDYYLTTGEKYFCRVFVI